MSYVGNTNTTQAFTPAVDYFSGNGSTVAFTLSRPVASTAQVQAVVNNVPQNPTDAFTVLNNTITFTSAPSSGTNNIYVQYTSPITQVAALPQSPQVFGNLQFSSSGARITGDFSNATVANRVAIQTSTVNGATRLNLLPNGTGVATEHLVFNSSDPANSSFGSVRINASDFAFQSMQNGTGSYLPMTFYTGGSERMRVDTSGNVGIGTSSPDARLRVSGGLNTLQARFAGVDGRGLAISTFSSVGTGDGGVTYSAGVGSDAQHVWRCGSTERARIDSSGNLLVNTTAQQTGGNGKLSVAGGSGGVAATLTNNSNASAYTTEIYNYTTSTGAGSGRYVKFAMGSTPTQTGSIIGDGTNTAYNTSSDYRLKENVAPMTGALALVMQQRPVTWTWKTSGKPGKGFIAHWLQEDGAGECVSGEKDAVDADGNPDYQGVDTSFLVATLTAAIQEQQAIITALTARVTALESK